MVYAVFAALRAPRPFLALLLAGGLAAPGLGAQAADEPAPVPVRTANWGLAEKWLPDRAMDRLMSLGVEPHWLPGGDVFWYRYERGDGVRHWLVDPGAKTKEPLFDREVLAAALTRLTGDPVDASALAPEELECVRDAAAIRFAREGERFEFDRATEELTRVDEPVETVAPPPDWANVSPDGAWCVYLRGYDLFAKRMDAPDAEETRLSTDGAPNFEWGGGDGPPPESATERRFVSVTWSPDSRRYAVTRSDARAVEDLWLVDTLARPRPKLVT